jgi:threonine synthase
MAPSLIEWQAGRAGPPVASIVPSPDIEGDTHGAASDRAGGRMTRFERPPELDLPAPDPATLVAGEPPSAGVWRYRGWLPDVEPVSLGEPMTPLIALGRPDGDVLMKLEGAQPTGSFKDRGTAVLVAWLRAQGAHDLIEDSSGNAGASMAAYAARAELRARVFVPETASPAKLGQIRAYGAEIVVVPGPRSAATDAAEQAVEAGGAVYASHLWQPAFLAGTSTFAYELWEQLGERAPEVVVAPLGGGTLLLGVHRGFARLREAGLIERVPRLVGVQAAACRPLADAFESGAPDASPSEPQPSLAEGIRIARPPRSPEILAAVRATGGTILAVTEEAIAAALRELLARGFYVEPTSAVALAGYRQLRADGGVGPEASVVIAITGHGLKTPAAIESILARR